MTTVTSAYFAIRSPRTSISTTVVMMRSFVTSSCAPT
ncbi:ORFL79C.iORF1 [Human betaherpesvirus 5]|nr:ORFL79C.iORF1 [Human betaherpesvirus 5]QHX40389.1 ORFL79C.iORF1 [Human betaherpesvirus 5]